MLFIVELRSTLTENSGEHNLINSLIPTTDHGAYHTRKIVIESEMLVDHIWWIAQ